jgi:hypothetical protein
LRRSNPREDPAGNIDDILDHDIIGLWTRKRSFTAEWEHRKQEFGIGDVHHNRHGAEHQANGTIRSGIAAALLTKLNDALRARNAVQCGMAANIYRSLSIQ